MTGTLPRKKDPTVVHRLEMGDLFLIIGGEGGYFPNGLIFLLRTPIMIKAHVLSLHSIHTWLAERFHVLSSDEWGLPCNPCPPRS